MAAIPPDVRLDPDAHKGVVVEKRPERVLAGRSWLFWPSLAILTLLALAPVVLHALFWPDIRTGDDPIDDLADRLFRQLLSARIWQSSVWLLALACLLSQRIAIRRGWPLTTVQLTGVAAITLYLCLALFFSPLATLGGYTGVELLPAVLLFGGGFAVAVLVDPRDGRTYLRCRKCEYEFVPSTDAPDKCPECGRRWLERRGLARVRERKRRPIVMMSALMLFGLAVGAFYAAPLLHKALPTSLLVRHATGDWFYLQQETWDRLHPANLSDEQILAVFSNLYNRAERGDLIALYGAQEWILTAIKGNRLPSHAQAELFHGSWSYEVRPEEIAAGAPAQVGLHIRHRRWELSTLWDVRVVSEGLWIDGGEFTRDPPVLAYHNSIILSGETDNYGPLDVTKPKFWTVEFDEPGEHALTAAYWVVVLPVRPPIANMPNATRPVRWDENGALVATPEAIFVRRYTVEGTIKVAP